MALGSRRTPERGSPFFSGVVLPVKGVAQQVLTTGGGVVTMTAAQALQGLLPCDCQDAQTITLPTAALLNAGIPGVAAGTSFDLDIINYGDTTLTVGLGTGITKTTIATVAAVMTIATLCSKRFTLICTSVANPSDPSTSDAWTVWAHGSIAAAVA